MGLVNLLRRIPGAPQLAVKPIWWGASVVRAVLGDRSEHMPATRDGIAYDLDLRENVQMRVFFNALDRAEIAALVAYLRPGDIAIDVGAHVGYYALHFARATGEAGRVVAFEPDPSNASRLTKNAALNGFGDRVRIVPAVASDHAGSMRLFLADGQSGGNSVYASMSRTDRFVECEATTIDAYCETNGIDRARVMKVDVEGHEPAVLRGASRMLREHRIDVVMIEYCPAWVRAIEAQPERFDEPLTGNGYVRIEPAELPAVDNVFNMLYVSPGLANGPKTH